MKKFLLLSIVFQFYVGCNENQSIEHLNSKKLGLDTVAKTYTVTTDDDSMNLAIAKAKETLDQFDKALKSKNPSYRHRLQEKIKIAMKSGNKTVLTYFRTQQKSRLKSLLKNYDNMSLK